MTECKPLNRYSIETNSLIFEGTKPIDDTHIDSISHLMQVNKPQEALPHRITFVFAQEEPVEMRSAELPDGQTYPAPSKEGNKTARYVHLDSMPEELQRVIREYQTLVHGCEVVGRRPNKFFKEVVSILNDAVQDLPDDVAPSEAGENVSA